ncbi:MAG: hypothetical protein LC737_00130 [Chloroflexi bacterium]|nr:hypothetical protein [Chloroflexota bacterium]
MTNPPEPQSRDASNWAQPVNKLRVGDVSQRAARGMVEGKQLTGPLRGFGQLWQKTYRIALRGAQVAPTEVVATWREQFSHFWPKGNSFYGSLSKGVAPGEVAILNMGEVGGQPLVTTGVYVIYADEESFSFMTPEGHPMAGMITFSSFARDECTHAQAQAFVRANDPLYEIGMRLGMSRMEDRFFGQMLRNVGAQFGVRGDVEIAAVLLDPKVQWKHFNNIWQNAGARTALYAVSAPLRRIRRR